MGLYGFKKQFWPMILDGTKRHTIRCPRRWPDQPGDVMHLYGNPRRADMFLLLRARCWATSPIVLGRNFIELAGVKLTRDERDGLAWADGFRPPCSTAAAPGPAFAEMAGFWRASMLPLTAAINYWEFPAVEVGASQQIRDLLSQIKTFGGRP